MSRDTDEPLPLVRPSSLRGSWFTREPASSESSGPISSLTGVPLLPSARRALLAGAFGGAVAGVVLLVVAGAVSGPLGRDVDVAMLIGRRIAPQVGSVGAASRVGLAAFALLGALAAAPLSLVTRHVARVVPMMLFAVVFSPIAWLAVHALLLPRLQPILATALPIVPMLIGAAAAGLAVALLTVPLRRRRAGSAAAQNLG